MAYSAQNVCSSCVDTFYLTPPTTCTKGTIVDCLVYSSATVCSKCVDGKMPIVSTGLTCVNGIISNCKSYKSFGVC